ncbi:MAG: hypothetical protein DRG11_05975 [Epsilonproteobacteria bacterium]|nr:MAG: hypothetical protein DRG11_05975 [Campylobacterota bacterium]
MKIQIQFVFSILLSFFLVGCSSFHPNNLKNIEHGMEFNEVIENLGKDYYIRKISLLNNQEFKHVVYPINNKKYYELYLLGRNNILTNSFLNENESNPWNKLVAGNKINFDDTRKNWIKSDTSNSWITPVILAYPFIYLSQIGTISSEQIYNLKLGMSEKDCINLLGEPHHRTDYKSGVILTYENSRFMGTVVYNLYMNKSILFKVERSLLQRLEE